MVEGITSMLEKLGADIDGLAATARSEARRLFARQVVCGQISEALLALVERTQRRPPARAAGIATGPGG